MRGLIDNSVNLGGEQTITGHKKFMQKNVDTNNLPESGTKFGDGITFVDVNNKRIGKISPSLNSSGLLTLDINSSSDLSGSTKYATISPRVTSSGDVGIWGSASAENSMFVTTAAHTFNTYSGYVKFGNGLIIQWGRASNTVSGSLMSITFPTPFTEATSYSVTGSSTLASGTNQGHDFVSSLTATNFKFQLNSDMAPANWIAIGR